tara:strand:- start:21858 stop:22025 length:168 start_codon:yes stop_codon:yes gene_type:complete
MGISDIKLFLLNTGTLAVSFSQIDTLLKIILLSVSIGYTIQRWYMLDKERREKDK